ncbi:MAG TPA: hypothetical protein VIP77_24185 [Jiangellaceae bacterium]
MSDEETFETVKYYTRARKFPQLLGRFPDGTKIPGGPYTVQQLLAGVGIIAFGSMTMGIWGIFGGIGDIVVLFMVGFAAMFFIGRLPMNGRNPFAAVLGFYKASVAPRGGRFQGKSIRIRRPRRMTHMTNVYYGPLPAIEPAPLDVSLEPAYAKPKVKARTQVGTSGQPRALPHGTSAGTSAPLTGLQALLAKTGESDDEKAVR